MLLNNSGSAWESCYLRLARGVVNSETLECGDVSPLSMRGHVRALQNAYCYRCPVRQSLAHELAPWTSTLVVRTWPLHSNYRNLPESVAPNSPGKLDFFQNSLFQYADEFGWDLRAWAVLANHYHFVAASPTDPGTLGRFLGKLHMKTAEQLNLWDNKPGRKVWFQFWDSHITFERSYLALLNYVNQNPVRHGIVPLAENYKWCSAAWFAQIAPSAFVKTVESFKTDQVSVPDDL
jgi:putative transposase